MKLLLSFLSAAVAAVGFAATPDSELDWIDGRDLPLEGKPFATPGHDYARLPAESVKELPLLSWACPAGLCFRFETNSDILRLRWTVAHKGPAAGAGNASAELYAGFDVYEWLPQSGWRWHAVGIPSAESRTTTVSTVWKPGRRCMIYFPMMYEIEKFELGVRKGAKVTKLPARPTVQKPVVLYGSSMVHGFCSSRPGMIWGNVLGRMLDVPVVNQGHSGQGKMEPPMVDYLAKIDASAYGFLCCGEQLPIDEMRKRYKPFLTALHKKRPDVPILIGEYYYTYGAGTADVNWGDYGPKEYFIRDLVGELRASDPVFWRNLYIVRQQDMMVADGDGTVDTAHVNDRGAWQIATAFADVLRKALGL